MSRSRAGGKGGGSGQREQEQGDRDGSRVTGMGAGCAGSTQGEKEVDQGNGSRSRMRGSRIRAMGDRAPAMAVRGRLQGRALSRGAVTAPHAPCHCHRSAPWGRGCCHWLLAHHPRSTERAQPAPPASRPKHPHTGVQPWPLCLPPATGGPAGPRRRSGDVGRGTPWPPRPLCPAATPSLCPGLPGQGGHSPRHRAMVGTWLCWLGPI